MNTLVINLTRFGDLLQTQPTIAGLTAEGREVGLVCLENFATAADLLEGVSAVRPLPGASFLARCDQNWRLALQEVEAFVQNLAQDMNPDLVINLTPSLPARILARRLPARERRGFLVDEFGFGQYQNPWAAFLQLSTGRRAASPFNVADLFCRAAGLRGPRPVFALRRPEAAAQTQARDLLVANQPEGTTGFVAMQLGASEDRRRWPLSHFQALGRRLWDERGLCPVLLGSDGEIPLGKRFEENGPPCVNLVGATDLSGLAAVLTQVQALVTNDTGTMHLAAGLSTPILALFLATAQPWDTGPCQANALCLEPDLDCHPCAFGQACAREQECRRAIRPDPVFDLLTGYLKTGRWPTARGLGLRAWLTRQGADGLMTLGSLSGHDQSDRGIWMRLQHDILGPFLDGAEPTSPDMGADMAFSPETRQALAATLDEASGLLELAVQQATLLGVSPRGALKTKFLTTCRRIESTLTTNPRTTALASLWACQSQEQARTVADLAILAARHRSLIAALAQAVGRV